MVVTPHAKSTAPPEWAVIPAKGGIPIYLRFGKKFLPPWDQTYRAFFQCNMLSQNQNIKISYVKYNRMLVFSSIQIMSMIKKIYSYTIAVFSKDGTLSWY